MHKFVITGGPCSGKTTLISHLKQELEERGYKVITVPESASELIANGICPSEKIAMSAFQNFVLALQISKEDLFAHAHNYYDADKVVVLCDRGIVDICEHIDMAKFEKLIAKRGLTLDSTYARYDAVFHMVTAADGAEEFYVWDDPIVSEAIDNAAKAESPADARKKDKKILDAWSRHPHVCKFDNSTDFEDKLMRALTEVCVILGEPLPNETLRKFIIKKPTKNELNMLNCTAVTEIVQTYLRPDGDVERKIRQRGSKESGYSFYYAEQYADSNERTETEEMITAAEYIAYLPEVDSSISPLSKTRYSFLYDGHCFDLDIYPFSNDQAVLEVEVENAKEKITMPPLHVIKDVTGDPNYRHSNLAKTQTLVHGDKAGQQTQPQKPSQPAQQANKPQNTERPKAEKKQETPKQPKVEPKAEPKVELKVEPKVEPKMEAPIVEQKPAVAEQKQKPQNTEQKAPAKKQEPKMELPLPQPQGGAPKLELPLMGGLDGFAMDLQQKPQQQQRQQPRQQKPQQQPQQNIKNEITNALETVLNSFGYTAQSHYCIGGVGENKICVMAAAKGFEVFLFERGKKVDVIECEDMIDASLMVIRQISDDGKQIKEMRDRFKGLVSPAHASQPVAQPAPQFTQQPHNNAPQPNNQFGGFNSGNGQTKQNANHKNQNQKQPMSVDDFFSDLLN